MRLLRRHPELGAALVRSNGAADFEVIAVIEAHQERWDGSGYPRGLAGPAIPLVARIAGVVDAYDAMITERPWARARSSFEATQELVDVKDVLFQGALVEQFIQAIGVFPTGALVELNTGEVGIVVRQNATRRLKPEIAIVLDAHKARLPKLRLLDLALGDRSGERDTARWVGRELPRGAYGIDSEDYFV
jgi:HD-GYP domain-containing protein (c-di-GMP phosphodiesterase class II)